MSRQIVNTRGQGLASSDGIRFALICLVAAIAVLVLFYFLNTGTKNHAQAMTVPAAAVSLAVVPAPVKT